MIECAVGSNYQSRIYIWYKRATAHTRLTRHWTLPKHDPPTRRGAGGLKYVRFNCPPGTWDTDTRPVPAYKRQERSALADWLAAPAGAPPLSPGLRFFWNGFEGIRFQGGPPVAPLGPPSLGRPVPRRPGTTRWPSFVGRDRDEIATRSRRLVRDESRLTAQSRGHLTAT
jgi:hypothetical protein